MLPRITSSASRAAASVGHGRVAAFVGRRTASTPAMGAGSSLGRRAAPTTSSSLPSRWPSWSSSYGRPRWFADDAASAAKNTEGGGDEAAAKPKDEDSDPCPPWQNPLHHNNPDYENKVLAEDFSPGEEMPVVPLPPFESDGGVLAPPHIHELADEIVRLNMLEVKELVDRIGDHFGFDDDAYAGGDDAGGEAGEAVEEVVEKTAFDLKLTGFDAKGKIKVIKEVRGATSLGLKEAKELVEGAPTVIKKDMKKEEAEELKAKLEAVGAQMEIV
mmetsp:Transcript_42611/g.90616  ORF Transcript_42611/g.90616 Transcript_42611/m.90616 type:complete len:273 (-) Transcript_42611:383-1201(-)